MKKTEVETLKELIERATALYGQARAEELRADLEQTCGDLTKLAAFEVGIDDEV